MPKLHTALPFVITRTSGSRVRLPMRRALFREAIEELGFYNPLTDETHLKFEPIIKRLKQGAQPTETVHNIFVKAKIFEQM